MKKTIKLSVCIFLLFLIQTSFQSCRKGTQDLKYVKPDREASFFKTSKPVSVEVEAFIRKLKSHNEKTGFLNYIPKDLGNPIWDKTIIRHKSNSSSTTSANDNDDVVEVITVPVTENEESLNAVIIIKTVNDSIVVISPYTNDYLYYLAHTTPIDYVKAKEVLDYF